MTRLYYTGILHTSKTPVWRSGTTLLPAHVQI